ncbi:hypothetical protein IMZ48_35105 [Candidatus Bathyarchaeota archaeon]|nr:hypothetical protein [Candidatus Bathyarchaeota archaeon]
MQEEKDLGGVCVSFGDGEEEEVVVADVEVLGVWLDGGTGAGGQTGAAAHIYSFVREGGRYC